MYGVEKVEAELGLEVLAALRPRGLTAAAAPPAGIPEEVAEEVAEAAAVVEVERARSEAGTETAATEPAARTTRADAARDHLADLVVLLALLDVTEDVVRGRDLLEALLGLRVTGIRVGMVLLGQLSVGALDVLVARAGLHAEHGVVVLLEPLALRRHVRLPLRRASPSPLPGAAPDP